MPRITGPFDVKMSPLKLDDAGADPTLGRFAIDKQYHGDLEAAGKGEMLSAGTAVKGSAGYVAIERVSGRLEGKSGSFVLQHAGTMNRGEPRLLVAIVPDSGAGEWAGIAGTLNIRIEGKQHFYDLEFAWNQSEPVAT